jgi:hypothetical protein
VLGEPPSLRASSSRPRRRARGERWQRRGKMPFKLPIRRARERYRRERLRLLFTSYHCTGNPPHRRLGQVPGHG